MDRNSGFLTWETENLLSKSVDLGLKAQLDDRGLAWMQEALAPSPPPPHRKAFKEFISLVLVTGEGEAQGVKQEWATQ